MRLLDRYLLRELMIPLAYILAGLLVVWIAFDLFARLDDFQEHHLQWSDVAEYYLTLTPETVVLILPVALLLGLLYALSNHARHQELTAIRAAGVSLWRLCIPYFGVGAVFSLALFSLNELVVPDTRELAERILDRRTTGGLEAGEGRAWKRELNLPNPRANRYWRADAYNIETHEMLRPIMVWRQPDGSIRKIHAARAHYVDEVWTFHDVIEHRYQTPQDVAPQIKQVEVLSIPELDETPELIRSEIRINNLSGSGATKKAQLSVEECLNYLRLHPQLSESQRNKIETQLHGRLAEPWTCLVVVLIAVPFAAPAGRRNVFVGVASGIFICFVYLLVLRLGLALGTGGYLPSWLAAWLPNLIFGTAGIFRMSRIR
ncbi:MAG TPA: LptF/LptG family permease [Methylomirabilota bacterium]|nr:LptF/LptG family permease [Methylomirabilota bacterium]